MKSSSSKSTASPPPLEHGMYRGVVKVSEPLPSVVGDDSDGLPPSSPIEKEITRAIDALKNNKIEPDIDPLGTYPKLATTQTTSDCWQDTPMPDGYCVPRVFIRSVAEAIEQAVIVYSPLLKSVEERENGILRVLQEISVYIRTPRHLFIEIYEKNPIWYDYAQITVTDCVTAEPLGTADLFPPTTQALLPNVNIPLYESPIVTDDAVPHMPQVEVSFLTNDHKLVGQTVSVPLDLFVRGTAVVTSLDDGTERDISYRAALVRKEFMEEIHFPNN